MRSHTDNMYLTFCDKSDILCLWSSPGNALSQSNHEKGIKQIPDEAHYTKHLTTNL